MQTYGREKKVILYDRIWFDMNWYNTIQYDMIWYDMIWYDMIWYDMIWYDMIWYDMIWYDMTWYDMIAQKLPVADTDHHSHSESGSTMPRCYWVWWSQFCCHSEAASVKFETTNLQLLFKTNDLYFVKST